MRYLNSNYDSLGFLSSVIHTFPRGKSSHKKSLVWLGWHKKRELSLSESVFPGYIGSPLRATPPLLQLIKKEISHIHFTCNLIFFIFLFFIMRLQSKWVLIRRGNFLIIFWASFFGPKSAAPSLEFMSPQKTELKLSSFAFDLQWQLFFGFNLCMTQFWTEMNLMKTEIQLCIIDDFS